jgi:hypothetical protein
MEKIAWEDVVKDIQYSENGRDERAKFEQPKGKIQVPARAIDL